MRESELYKPIQRWLRNRGYIVDEKWKNKGGSKFRVDVAGIRSFGNRFYDDIEIVTVEVKVRGVYTSLGQAENYRDFSHKVYFATTKPYEELKEDAARRNLGLLLVHKRTKRVKEILSAVPLRPRNEAQMIEFLHNFNILRCVLCHCYFDWRLKKERWYRTAKFKK